MKLIDEKGKLFGIVNIVDLSVLLIVVLLAGAVGYKTLGRKLKIADSNVKEATVTLKCPLYTDTVAKALQTQIGKKLVSGTNYIDGVIDAVSYTDGDYTMTTADGKIFITKHPTRKDIYVTLKVKVDPDAAVFKLGTEEIHVGDQYEVKTQTVSVKGSVESISM